MSAAKKATKAKCVTDEVRDYINPSQLLDVFPKGKKNKRFQNEELGEENMSRLVGMGQYQAGMKKKKIDVESTSEFRQKILELVDHQIKERNQCNEKVLNSLTEVTTQGEAEYNALKDNEQKLEHLTVTYMKCIQQSTKACKQKLDALKEIRDSLKKQCEDLHNRHEAEGEKMADEFESDIKKIQAEAITESKRKSLESLNRTIFQFMKNDD